MNKKNQSILLKRLQSLTWRIGMMILAVVVSFALDNINLLDLNPQLTILLGLVLGEVSKWLNTQK